MAPSIEVNNLNFRINYKPQPSQEFNQLITSVAVIATIAGALFLLPSPLSFIAATIVGFIGYKAVDSNYFPNTKLLLNCLNTLSNIAQTCVLIKTANTSSNTVRNDHFHKRRPSSPVYCPPGAARYDY